jgi:DNA-damage-inducible protein D
MSIFEKIRLTNEFGQEYWSARHLAKALDYQDYRNFLVAIDKAMQACKNSGQEIFDHFGEATEMVSLGSGAKREISDYHLSRYACYLVVQNGDPDKEVVALGQTYFKNEEIPDAETAHRKNPRERGSSMKERDNQIIIFKTEDEKISHSVAVKKERSADNSGEA